MNLVHSDDLFTSLLEMEKCYNNDCVYFKIKSDTLRDWKVDMVQSWQIANLCFYIDIDHKMPNQK